ncbi:hypothetical protein [Vannielia litorea]|uniref:hypothetical protein n=1 Tax=Vannielia litorea TaxID=1217970 RepID=UPI001BCEB7BC|nr:hypothetical protein [Vannielia litorea]MBS8227415.1 hypothetical protein [Vannielia litorea]
MSKFKKPGLRRGGFLRSVVWAMMLGGVALCTAGTLPNARADAAGTIVVGNDRGGFIRARLREMQRIRASGDRVEIRGRVCFSTCTMYLGAEDICVSPKTTFGFHGPAMAIGRLTPEQFDYLSKLIASHYPEPLANWYMAEGRMRTSGLYRMSGSDLIRLGVPRCQNG